MLFISNWWSDRKINVNLTFGIFIFFLIRLKSLGSLKPGNTLKKINKFWSYTTDHLWWKIVMQASDRDWPAHVLTFGVCPLCWTTPIAHALHFYFFSQPSIFFSALALCLLFALRATSSASLPFVAPADTSGEDKTVWPYDWSRAVNVKKLGNHARLLREMEIYINHFKLL